jgi:hypothetical protein
MALIIGLFTTVGGTALQKKNIYGNKNMTEAGVL